MELRELVNAALISIYSGSPPSPVASEWAASSSNYVFHDETIELIIGSLCFLFVSMSDRL